MANTTQDEIYQKFLEVSRQQAAEMTQTTQSLADLILQADDVRRDFAAQTARTKATSSGSSASGASAGSSPSKDGGGGSVLSTVFDVFKSGLGVSPIIQGILGLFGGGDKPAPPPLVKYALPPSIHFEAAEVNGRVANVDYDQAGMARGYAAPKAGSVQTPSDGGSGSAAGGGAAP